MYNLVFTDEAKKDLKDIMNYLYDKLGSKQALLNFKSAFNKCINNLSYYDLGTSSHFDKSVKVVAFSNYLLFYKVNEFNDEIIVLTIVHKSQNIR